MRARCHCHQASRTVAATRSCAALARLSTARAFGVGQRQRCDCARRAATAARRRRPRIRGHRGCRFRPVGLARQLPALPARASRPGPPAVGRGPLHVALARLGPRAGAPRPRRRPAGGSSWSAGVGRLRLRSLWPGRQGAGSCSRSQRARAAAMRFVRVLRCIRCSSVENNPREIGKRRPQRSRRARRVPQRAARTQARTGFSEGRDPPRRSGEGRPLRAFGSGRRVRAAASSRVAGATVDSAPGISCRQGQHCAAEDSGSARSPGPWQRVPCRVGLGIDVASARQRPRVRHGCRRGLVLVLVVTQCARSASLSCPQ